MITSRGLIIVVVLTNEKWSIFRDRIYHTTVAFITAVAIIFGALHIELSTQPVTVIRTHGIEIPIGIHTAHIVHGRGYCSLDARVVSSSIKGETTPTANTKNADTFRIYIITDSQIIDCRTEIFRANLGRSEVTGCTTALSVERRIKRNG